MVTIKDIKYLIKDIIKISLVVDVYKDGVLVGSSVPIKSRCYDESFTEYEDKDRRPSIMASTSCCVRSGGISFAIAPRKISSSSVYEK